MLTMPKTGPGASATSAHDQPTRAVSQGTMRIVSMVSRNPMQVCTVSAVPTCDGSDSSLTAAENCALSATTANPQTRQTMVRIAGVANVPPTTRQQAPEITRLTVAIAVRPQRSARRPARALPSAPIATAEKPATRAAASLHPA